MSFPSSFSPLPLILLRQIHSDGPPVVDIFRLPVQEQLRSWPKIMERCPLLLVLNVKLRTSQASFQHQDPPLFRACGMVCGARA